jgi:hypothetical protein
VTVDNNGWEHEADLLQANSERKTVNCWLQKIPECGDVSHSLQPLQPAEPATALSQKPGNPLPAACTAGSIFQV